MSKNTKNQFKLLPVAAAIVLAYSNVYAEDLTEVQALITPESSVSVGVGGVNNASDAKRFSQYTGLNKNASVLLDVEMNKRDDASGVWTILNGRNLGLDTRELNFSQSKQGDWKYKIDFNEIVRNDPYIINTGMTGIGSTTPTVNLIATPSMPTAWATANKIGFGTPFVIGASNGIAGSDVELQLKRTAIGLSGDKWLTPEVQVEVAFRNEEKKGARMFGRAGLNSTDMGLQTNAGTGNANGGWAVLLTPEPINSTIRTMEGKVNFNRDQLALTAGYYGSFYINANGSLSPIVPDTLNRGLLWNGCVTAGCSTVQQLASSAVALPPDNQAHQVYASGTYAYSDTTRTNFKVAFTRATQDVSFTGMGLTPATTAPASLGGVVDTKLVQLGLTMRPLTQLSVNGSFRYEDRADNTPIAVYNTNGVPINPTTNAMNGLNNTTNWGSGTQTRTTAKLDGTYRLPQGYSVSLGGDWERKNSPLPPANTSLFSKQVFFRSTLDEYGVHTELRKALSETLNASIGVELKQRRGQGDWMTTSGLGANLNGLVVFDPSMAASAYVAAVGATPAIPAVSGGNYVLADMYMDRNRGKLRGSLDWEPIQKLSLQAVIEHLQDDYLRAEPATPFQGVAVVAGARTISSDSLSIDSTYIVSEGWKANGFWTRTVNRWNVNKINIGDDTRNTADTIGLGINGKPTEKFSIGMDVLTTRDKTTFNNVVAYAATSSTNPANLADANGNIVGFGTTPGNFLPDINYTTNKLNLHAEYAIDKAAAVQTAVTYQYFTTDDWQWSYNGVPFLYSDNTTVSQPMSQKLIFVAARYVYKF